ncbi:MAG: hypothetical protein Q8P97_00850, partial [bacterium]|nr:hypothetical protein [bacterium]
ERFQKGGSMEIKWQTTGINSNYAVGIGLLNSAGTQVAVICASCSTGTSSGYYQWVIPTTIADGQYNIRAYITAFNAVAPNLDFSDAPFSIVTAGTANKLSAYYVPGNKSVYAAGEKISLSIKGIELFDGSPGEPSEGFNVQVYLRGLTDGYSLQGYNATYNKQTGYWDAQLTAPADTSKSYQIDSAFYCSNGSLACGPRYAGQDIQINVTFTFQVIGSGKQPVTVVSPNGGEVYQAGQTAQMPIKWTADCKFMSFSIALTKGNAVVQMINDSVPVGICSAGQLAVPYNTTWPIPKTLSAGNDYKLLINGSTGDGSGIGDDSNAPFTIGSAGAGTSDASDLSNLASALNNIQASVAAIAEALKSLLTLR